LRGALRRLDHAAIFQHTRLQPLLDQADDPSIADSVFDESDEPLSAQSIEEPRYVGVENPVDFACIDSVCERIQRIVLAASGPEPVAKAQELRLVAVRSSRSPRLSRPAAPIRAAEDGLANLPLFSSGSSVAMSKRALL